jgi:hypothetical protein
MEDSLKVEFSDDLTKPSTRSHQHKLKQLNQTIQLFQIGIILAMSFATATLFLLSGTPAILNVFVLASVVAFGLLLREKLADVAIPSETMIFFAQWLFWLIYSRLMLAIEDVSPPFDSFWFHSIVTLVTLLLPIILVLNRVSNNTISERQLYVIAILMTMSTIIPFRDNGLFYNFYNAITRDVLASFLYYIIYYYHSLVKRFLPMDKILLIYVQILYVLFGEPIISIVFFVIHFGYYVVRLLTVVQRVSTHMDVHQGKKTVLNMVHRKNGGDSEKTPTEVVANV